MADTDATPPMAEARLGSGPPGTILRFTIPKNGGYVVEATLLQGVKPVASWESIEILGKTTNVELIPVANYTLMIDVVFTKPDASEVTLEFSSHNGDQLIRRAKTQFSGKKPQIGRSLTAIRVEK